MHEFFNLFFIEINLSTTCSNKNFLRWTSKPILFNCFLLVVYCLFLNFCSKLPIWSAMVEGFVGVEWSNLGLINFCYGCISILNLEPLYMHEQREAVINKKIMKINQKVFAEQYRGKNEFSNQRKYEYSRDWWTREKWMGYL